MSTHQAQAANPSPVTPPVIPPSVIVVMTTDQPFVRALDEAMRAAGGQVLQTTTPVAFVDALDRIFPPLALLDLAGPGDWQAALTRSKLKPHTRTIPIHAFAHEADQAVRQAAVQAGAAAVWPAHRLLAGLAELVRQQQNPPLRYPAGWDEPLSAEACAGVAAFNAGDYFDQHEHFEHAWMAESRPIRDLYQGILQVGLAFYQIERDNWAGAIKMFRRGLPRLKGLPAICQGLELAAFRMAAEAIYQEISELGPQRLPTFDRRKFPQLAVVK